MMYKLTFRTALRILVSRMDCIQGVHIPCRECFLGKITDKEKITCSKLSSAATVYVQEYINKLDLMMGTTKKGIKEDASKLL